MRRIFLLAVLGAALAGCGGQRESSPAAPTTRQTRVDWLGHECFQITSSFGLKIVTNPYDPSYGKLGSLRPDAVLISTELSACNNTDPIDNTPVILRGAVGNGLNNASGFRIRGIATYQDPNKQTDLMNLVFSWTMDGLRICFAGNIQRPLTGFELSQIGSVDVLFLPTGTPSSLGDEERGQLIGQLHPRVIIPMGSRSSVESWAATQPHTYRVGGPSVFLNYQTLPVEQTVLLLSAP